MDMGVQELGLLDPGSRLSVMVENVVLAGPHGMGDDQKLLAQEVSHDLMWHQELWDQRCSA